MNFNGLESSSIHTKKERQEKLLGVKWAILNFYILASTWDVLVAERV